MADLAALNKSVSLTSASGDFVLVAKTLAAAHGRLDFARQMAQHLPSIRAREVLEKAAVPPMGLPDAGAAIAPYKELVAGFFGSLAEFSAYSRIYNANDFYRVALRTHIAIMTSALGQ